MSGLQIFQMNIIDIPNSPEGLLFNYAFSGNNKECLNLLKSGVNPNEKIITNNNNNWKSTPLIASVVNGHYETSELLLNGGADPNISDGLQNHKSTALSYAVLNNDPVMCELLLQHGATDIRSTFGYSPIKEAILMAGDGVNNTEVLLLLVKYINSFRLNYMSDLYNTYMDNAHPNPILIYLYIDFSDTYGFSVNRIKQCNYILQKAKSYGHKDVIKHILNDLVARTEPSVEYMEKYYGRKLSEHELKLLTGYRKHLKMTENVACREGYMEICNYLKELRNKIHLYRYMSDYKNKGNLPADVNIIRKLNEYLGYGKKISKKKIQFTK